MYICLIKFAIFLSLSTGFAETRYSNFRNTGTLNASRRTFRPTQTNIKVTENNQYEVLARRICPFYNVSYTKELKIKQNMALKVVDALIKSLTDTRTGSPHFPVESIVPSPGFEKYRNKDEFTIYYGVDENKPVVGYLTGTPARPGCKAVRPTNLCHVKDSHKRMALIFEEYVRKSIHKVCYFFRDGGFWKRFTVRSNEAGDLMAIVMTHPYSLSQEEMAIERANLTSYFLLHEPNLILYHQECEHVDCSSNVNSYIKLAGNKPYLQEQMRNITFRISPHSFFQINKKAAEQMVNTIWGKMDVTNITTFLDLYSGVGLYSLLGSHRLNNSFGVEYLEGAVIDARNNAELNNITNCEFIAGRVEREMKELLLKKVTNSTEILVLVNPGRAGISNKVAKMVRRDKRIKKIVYVSCKPDNIHTFKNFIQLCKRKRMYSEPFRIKQICLFDLFPRTAHYEMVLQMER